MKAEVQCIAVVTWGMEDMESIVLEAWTVMAIILYLFLTEQCISRIEQPHSRNMFVLKVLSSLFYQKTRNIKINVVKRLVFEDPTNIMMRGIFHSCYEFEVFPLETGSLSGIY